MHNQQDILSLLRQITSAYQSTHELSTIEDIVPRRVESTVELDELNEKLRDMDFRKKMVIIPPFVMINVAFY